MKKHLTTVIFLFGLLCTGYSQDKIITLNNDTIDCKITKISDNTIYYEMIIKGVKTSGNVDHNRIFKYIISAETSSGARKETDVSKDPFASADTVQRISPPTYHLRNIKTPREKKKVVRKEPFNRLRFAMNGGIGYLSGTPKAAEVKMAGMKLSADQKNSYYEGLKSGLCAGADLTFLIIPDLGAGFRYKFFNTSTSLEGFFNDGDQYNLYYGTFGENIYVNFVGGTFLFQHLIGKKKSFKLSAATSVGSTYLRDEASLFSSAYLLTGKNIGADFNLGSEYFLSGNISVGTELSLFYSSIKKIKVEDGYSTTTVELKKDKYVNLSRLEFSIGIRVYLWNK